MDMLRRKIGDFYLVGHIGTGGMSKVYLGMNPRTREKRAVKILAKRASGMPSVYARFLREVEIIRSLCHPNIVKIYDSGTLEDCYYYMMEYMPGGSLAERQAKHKLSLNLVLDIFNHICDAMAHAHDRGIIHRDLKPANILLTADEMPCVSDFGIAKALDGGVAALTRSNEIMGTIAYLAPEQRYSTKRVDRRADVYALGAILYELVMGFPPLGKFPWPRETQPKFPESLQSIMEKCLAINPDQRFMHAGHLMVELEKHQRGGNGRSCNPIPFADPSCLEHATPANSDRIEGWFQTLRLGTTRERLSIVREMVEVMEPREAKALLKLFAGEEDKVRWGLIRVLGDLKVAAATPMILTELKNPYHRECAIEALGNIGSEEAFVPIRDFLLGNPDSANIALLPLARTGRQKSLKYLRQYLSSDMAVVRMAAVRAIAAVEVCESLDILKSHLPRECDEKIRQTVQLSACGLEAALAEKETLVTAKPA